MRPRADGRDTRNARGRATVRAIEKEAVRLALDHGIDALTVDQICAGVGISQRSFFNHFDAKEDALLGWELPQLDDDRVRAYLADHDVGVLTGALKLVRLPSELSEDPSLALARFQVLARAPILSERLAMRMRPVALRAEAVILEKLRNIAGPDVDPAELPATASAITAMAAALLVHPQGPPGTLPPLAVPTDAASALYRMSWVWPRML